MLYIEPGARPRIDQCIDGIEEVLRGPGDLAYALTRVAKLYELQRPHNFRTLNEIVGVLENTRHEYQRTQLDPYENAKRVQNGDVFDDDSDRGRADVSDGLASPDGHRPGLVRTTVVGGA